MRLRPVATACGLAGIALLLFVFRLSAPPLSQAESDFNTQAQSIANGHTPLFFHVREEQWLQPAAVYANAAIRAVGGDDVSGRLASAVAAAISVALLFLIAHEITGPWWVNILASVTLMLTPAFWSFAQRGTDAIVPVALPPALALERVALPQGRCAPDAGAWPRRCWGSARTRTRLRH